ncbi:hypothetical protein [Agriterribacter sp.]|uniref:hypothetical protein n=1 Tax=Agriterribacter sp. TaxID=2821509 RepID=UPI002C2BA5F4|nr:hypothetical protein [Agriterribacter sp.]HRP55613.1 hypothetical protein [Agriterribacter sp.]
MNVKLIDKLKSWDGVYIEYVTKLYDENAVNAHFFEDLVAISNNEQDLQKVTTWLIKHHYDNGNTLPNSLTEKLLSTCLTIENWEAKLHILQIFHHFKLTKTSIPVLEHFLQNCLTDKNKFVKAWAYNGLYELTKYIPELKNELKFICERAMGTESASMRTKRLQFRASFAFPFTRQARLF